MNNDFTILLFQPKNRPDSLLRYLAKSFRKINQIEEAYFCCLHKEGSNEQPSITIALALNEQFSSIDKDLKLIIDNSGFDEIIVVNILDDPFKSYFKNINPFYLKDK